MTDDPHALVSDSLIAPARQAYPILPSDSIPLASATKAIYVGTGGDIALRAVGSPADVMLRNVPSGAVLAIRVSSVRDTGTTAADIVGLA